MPRVNLYVREDDYEAYEAIVDKPKWLHRAIHDTPAQRLPLNVIRGEVIKKPVAQIAKKPVGISNPTSNPTPDVAGTIPAKKTEPFKFPPSAASQIIKTPAEAKRAVDTPQFIDKKYSSRKPGSKERHIEL